MNYGGGGLRDAGYEADTDTMPKRRGSVKQMAARFSLIQSMSNSPQCSRFESPVPPSRPTSRAGSSCGMMMAGSPMTVRSSPEPKLLTFRPSASPCFSNSSPAYLPPSWAGSGSSNQESTTRVIRINQQSLLTSSAAPAALPAVDDQQPLFSRLACPPAAPHPSPSSPLPASSLQQQIMSPPTPVWPPSGSVRPSSSPSPIFQPTK